MGGFNMTTKANKSLKPNFSVNMPRTKVKNNKTNKKNLKNNLFISKFKKKVNSIP